MSRIEAWCGYHTQSRQRQVRCIDAYSSLSTTIVLLRVWKVPRMNRTLDFNAAYYFGWAMYWLLLLEADHPPFETVGHAQSAPNNFLGLLHGRLS